MSGQRASEIECPGGKFLIVPELPPDRRVDVMSHWEIVKALYLQAKLQKMRLPLAHALHIIDEWSVKPDFPAFP